MLARRAPGERTTMHSANVYRVLFAKLGPQQWWPADSPLEVMVGAMLVQNTAWKNVERAISNLRDAGLLDAHRLAALDEAELAELIRPAGYYRIKAKRLRHLLDFLIDRYDGSIESMAAVPTDVLRAELLDVHGVGPETADSILNYALAKPALVVDAYTHRIWTRHGWIDADSDYHMLQEEVARGLPDDPQIYNEMHALLVHVGHHWCKRTPKCETCPLKELLPASGVQC
jgi:endonuclease III related protein